jgi:hypothetical protein
MQDGFTSKTPLFVVFGVLLFAALLFSFPFIAREVLNFPFESYLAEGSRGQFYLILWAGAHIIGMFIYYLVFSWCFREIAGLTDSTAVRRTILLMGALVCGGYLFVELWRGYSTGSNGVVLQRLFLTGLALSVCGSAIDAIRRGPYAPIVYDRSGYRA